MKVLEANVRILDIATNDVAISEVSGPNWKDYNIRPPVLVHWYVLPKAVPSDNTDGGAIHQAWAL